MRMRMRSLISDTRLNARSHEAENIINYNMTRTKQKNQIIMNSEFIICSQITIWITWLLVLATFVSYAFYQHIRTLASRNSLRLIINIMHYAIMGYVRCAANIFSFFLLKIEILMQTVFLSILCLSSRQFDSILCWYFVW